MQIFRAFETALFLWFERKYTVKRKKPQNEVKMSMTKRGSLKSSFLRYEQFHRELV